MPSTAPNTTHPPTGKPSTESDTRDKKSTHRSPAFPFISLSKAVERIKTLHDKEGRHPARFDIAAGHWGYQAKSSGALQTVGALKQYGLLKVDEGTGADRKLSLTQRALTIILDSREGAKERALSDAAMSPKLYADLFSKYGKALPSDANLSSYLTLDLAFNPASVDGVIGAYKETLPYVMGAPSTTLSGNDPDKDGPSEAREEDMNAEGQRGIVTPPAGMAPPPAKPPTIHGEEEYFRARLAGGRMVRVLFQGTPPTQSEIQKLITLLECTKDQYPVEAKSTGEA